MDSKPLIDRLVQWMSQSIGLKLFTIGFLLLILLIPAGMIQSTIREREMRRATAILEITDKWGGAQTLGGPMLTVPYQIHSKDDKGRPVVSVRKAHFLPETLDISGQVNSEIRYRGIYEAVLYQSALDITGRFPALDFKEWGVAAPEDILWKDAKISLGISDMKGIRSVGSLKWNDRDVAFDPGLEGTVLKSGVHARVNAMPGPASFKVSLQLNGSGELQFLPFGKVTTVDLRSSWASPSFQGSFLPLERRIRPDGFQAHWQVLQLNRNYPQQWSGADPEVEGSAFGVALRPAVDQYQKTERSTKYAVLFILLTFGTLFFMELRGSSRRASAIQYLLIGLAIVFFYSLLLSLAEHIGFQRAYAVSAAAIVVMISLYAKGVFQTPRVTAIVAVLMAVQYAYLFVLLQLEDYTLLFGNLGLLIALGLSMYLSRRADWKTPPSSN